MRFRQRDEVLGQSPYCTPAAAAKRRSVYPRGAGPRFSGSVFFAHACTSARRQIRPTASVSVGAGKSGRLTHRSAVRRGTSSIEAISTTLASSGAMAEKGTKSADGRTCGGIPASIGYGGLSATTPERSRPNVRPANPSALARR